MSTRYPRAIWKPLPESGSEFSATRRRLLIYHTIVGSAQGAYDYFKNSTNLESHMILPYQGPPWQIMEFSDTADANYHANDIALSVETEDNGDPAHDPWTRSQVDELVAFGVWCVRNPEFDIPAQRATGPFGEGIGYHAMWGAPSDWTPAVGKTCPGAARIVQFNEQVLPRIIAEVNQEDDMGWLEDRERVIGQLDFIRAGIDQNLTPAVFRIEAALGSNDPAALAEAIVAHLPNDIAKQFSDELAARLAD